MVIQILVEEFKADIYARSVYGSHVLHVAAQGDQPLPIYYFVRRHSMSLDDRDLKMSTPLHWACHSKSEVAMNYIMALNADLEAKD
jgi:ankyrin repeat protein